MHLAICCLFSVKDNFEAIILNYSNLPLVYQLALSEEAAIARKEA